jgi:hypothetical protein
LEFDSLANIVANPQIGELLVSKVLETWNNKTLNENFGM